MRRLVAACLYVGATGCLLVAWPASAASPLKEPAATVTPPAGFSDEQGAPPDRGHPVPSRVWSQPSGQLLWARLHPSLVAPEPAEKATLDQELSRWVVALTRGRTIRLRRSDLAVVQGTTRYQAWFTGDIRGERHGAALIAPVAAGTLEVLFLGPPGASPESLADDWAAVLEGVSVTQPRAPSPRTTYRDPSGLALEPPPGFYDLPTGAAPTSQRAAERKQVWVRHGLGGQQALSVSILEGTAAATLREQSRAAHDARPVLLSQVLNMPVPKPGTGGALPFTLGGTTTLLLYQALPGEKLSLSALWLGDQDRVMVLGYVANRDDFAGQLPAFAALCAQIRADRPTWPYVIASSAALALAALIVLWRRRRS